MNVKRLEKKLSESSQEAGLAFLQANQKDYGLAGGTSSRFLRRYEPSENLPLFFGVLSGAGRGDKLFLYPQKIQPRVG